ncbi:protein phosphatase Slingshot homolog 3 [Nothoprocta perdicaria]|uniref:protein phosphatase Slingshot homolog 3 n=1 Tax=Nothoprocta perdicaria TaxID=30464 RepID=UPI000E1C0F61|nr:protein phosphatase Slingshot homolog 3 [Nothoprocta perdicaria]
MFPGCSFQGKHLPRSNARRVPGTLSQEEDVPRRGKLQRRQSFVVVRGAALLLPAEEPPAAEAPAGRGAPGRQEQHLELMMRLLRPQDAVRLVGAPGGTAGGAGGVGRAGAVLQELHRACGEAARGGHIPGGQALAWAAHYAANVTSEQSCINEWLAMADLESVRPSSPPPGPAAPELTERAVRALLRDVMAAADLESVTSKEVRTELERRTGHSLAQHKDFIDNEMLLVLAQMDRPSRIFPHLYLGSEWNAANLEELQQNQVTHILNVAREIDNFFPALFTYMNVRVYDEDTAQLLPHWNDTFHFLSDVRARRGRVLVHCRMGLSRSAATVLAYAMKEFGWPLERALRHVRRCRPGVVPNPGFMRQLDFYQGILQASCRTATPRSSAAHP